MESWLLGENDPLAPKHYCITINMSINTANNSLLSPRIRYLALTVRWSAIAAMATILILGTYSLVHQSFSWTARPLLGVVATVRPSPASTIDPQLALWLELLPAAVLFYGLLRLVQMMRACERGEIFFPSCRDPLAGFF